MTNPADLIQQMITRGLARIRTADIGTVSYVAAYDRVSVKIKHTTAGQVCEHTNVPVLPQGIGPCRICSMPAVGDTVVLAYLQYDPSAMLQIRGAISDINTQAQYLQPVVLGAIDTADSPPTKIPAAGETIISHSSGSYIRFAADGTIEIHATALIIPT